MGKRQPLPPENFRLLEKLEQRSGSSGKRFESPFPPSNSSRVALNGRMVRPLRAGRAVAVRRAGGGQVLCPARRYAIRIDSGEFKIEVEAGEEDALFLSLLFGPNGKASVTLLLESDAGIACFTDVSLLRESSASFTSICRGKGSKFMRDAVCVGENATVRHNAVCLGTGDERRECKALFSGPGGKASLLGLYFACGNFIENKVSVEHSFPFCKSRVLYSGALLGSSARTRWVGEGVIGEGGKGSDLRETNKNFILTPGAKAFCEPNLEIKTGDVVSAGHSSSIGHFDPAQVFYLRSRGFGEKEARKMMVEGFFKEILSGMESKEAEGAFNDFCKKVEGKCTS